MSEKRPFIVTFIGDGCIFGAFLLILSLFPTFLERIGIYSAPFHAFLNVPILSENTITLLIAITLLVISYAYLNLKIWGYWLMVCINVLFLIGWVIAAQQSGYESFYENSITVIIGLIFILPTKKYFDQKTSK
ncbi:MAG: hypothetical protein K0R93_3725 [Anaerosolibacter sp.]|uniref:hypothetical protein n=1 Tax=Anaerosolibacter sp. TaxID=1872527 RepID=UPI00261D09DC|nr:hypothetical protein [Anaerosolibacter sp.]MDF2548827.1 hypothetical protein [Anaerosolibacter sp.]